MRTLIIGDVHGCFQELEDLLQEISYRPKQDRLIFIGDLINKGPASLEVFDLFTKLDAESLIGNHELALLQQVRGERPENERRHNLREEFGNRFDELIDSIQQWPRLIRLPGVLLVHAGVPPSVRPETVDLHTLVNIRTWGDKGMVYQAGDSPWYDQYTGKEHVVFGHWAALRGLQTPQFTGLDTGCVYGGSLTALILPEHRLVSIPARRPYQPV